LRSAAYTGHSTAELIDEIIVVRNSLVEADNERLAIVSRHPENRDIFDMIACTNLAADAEDNPRTLRVLLSVSSYIQNNPNIPRDALNNIAAWIFFKDTDTVSKLNT